MRELVTLLGYKVDDSGREQYNKGIDQTKQKQQSLTASMLKANIIMGVASRAVGAAFGFIKDSVIGATAETERYRVTLGTMMGDQEKANKIIHDLDYGEGMFEGSKISDFYGTKNAIGGLQNMVTFGIKAEEAGDLLTRLGDIAQGNTEAFVSMSNNMGQVFAKGKADATDLKQFVMQGFDVVGVIAEQTGRSREEIQKSGVTYEQTAMALRVLTSEGGKYHKMLEKQMNTLGGILKQFESLKAVVAEAIGFGINEELKELLKYLLEIGRAGQETFVNKFVSAIKLVIHWIFQIIIMWEVLGYRLEDMGAFELVGKFFEDLREVAGYALTGIMNLVVAVGRTLIEAFRAAYAFIGPVILALGPLIQKVLNFAAKGVEGLIPIFQMLTPPLAFIGNLLGVIITGLGGIIDFLSPLAPLIVGIIAIIKIWTAIQWLLNIAMMANPIGLIIVAVIAAVALIVGLVMVIIKNWDKIKAFFIALGKKIAEVFTALVNKIKQIFSGVIEWIKNAWSAISDWFARLWEGIISVAINVWNTIKAWFSNLIDGIKNIWSGIIGFFSGLWEAIKQGPAAAIEFIRNAFFGLFNSIQEKLFAFINRIREGWEAVKGFFGGIWDGAVNFITGGDSGRGQPQPAYAGGGSQAAMAGTVGQTSNYAYNSTGGSSTVNANTNINVNVPQGTPQEQSEAIARQVNAQFDARLADQINSSRANIPSPETRRH